MARTFKTVEIDGIEFEVGQVGARVARDIGLRMLDVHGQVLAALGSADDVDARMAKADPSRALGAVGALGRSLVAMAQAMRTKEFWSEVQKPLFEQVLQGKRQILRDDVYDELFMGHLDREMALLKVCVDHNCGDFTAAFAGTNEVTQTLRAAMGQTSPSAPAGEGIEPTGTSGPPSSGI